MCRKAAQNVPPILTFPLNRQWPRHGCRGLNTFIDAGRGRSNLTYGIAPAMRRSVLAARVSRAARRSRVVFHHLGKCHDPRGKAETFETRRHIRQRFDLDRSRRNRGGCDKSVHRQLYAVLVTTIIANRTISALIAQEMLHSGSAIPRLLWSVARRIRS